MSKDVVKIVIIGHVDHGKSTLIGRLLLDTNSLPKEKIVEIKRISKDLGKEAELAFLTDQLKEEREHNITIDTTQIFFKTRNRNYVIIDAPGHVEFIKNMITGASLAEAAILIIDVQEGVMEQTRRHAYLIKMLGIENIIVVLNKMDLVDYRKEKFDRVKEELSRFLDVLKIKPVFLVPVSARYGINISTKSKMSWYEGPSLLKALDLLILDKKAVKKPLRFPIQDVYEIKGEKIIVGRVTSGTIEEGQNVIILPSYKKTRIKTIKLFDGQEKKAEEGKNVGLVLDKSISGKRGEIITLEKEAPKPTNRFKGNIFWMSNEPLRLNKTVTLKCATQEVECFVENIKRRINSATLETIEENAHELKLNEAGIVIFKTKEPIVTEKFNFIEELGRFVIESGYNLQGAGIIT